MKLSEYCRKKRESTGLNVLAFSKKLGCSHSYILKLESGAYDSPTSLIVAKVILKYDLDIEDFENIEGIDYSNDFIEDIKRHLNRSIGTKMVINTKNIIEKLRKEYLLPNGYKDIDSSRMAGNLIMNQSKYYSFHDSSSTFKSVEDSISNEQATIYPACVDYTCQKDNKILFVKVIDIRSTIVVNVDKERIYSYIMQTIGEISCDYFEVKGINDEYDILLVTPSEKVYEYVCGILSNINKGRHTNYRIGISLVRPKRPMIEPRF